MISVVGNLAFWISAFRWKANHVLPVVAIRIKIGAGIRRTSFRIGVLQAFHFKIQFTRSGLQRLPETRPDPGLFLSGLSGTVQRQSTRTASEISRGRVALFVNAGLETSPDRQRRGSVSGYRAIW